MKGTLTRKQREVQDREGRIIELARSMIVQDGYHGLSMDRIAEALEYSKGTIYQHFSCKEEILLALVNQTMDQRLDLFRRAAAFRGGSRERIMAVGAACELFFQLYPDHLHIEHTVRISSIREKTSEQRRMCLESCEARCSEVVRGVVRDAVAVGDWQVSDDFGVDELTFGLWSITFGGYSIAATSPSLTNLGIHEPLLAIRRNCIRLLDGVGWKPLSSELDLSSIIERIKREVFPAEFARVERDAPT
jgi:AcrR family transcriptional regulator